MTQQTDSRKPETHQRPKPGQEKAKGKKAAHHETAELSADEQREILSVEIEKAEKLAESELELSHWFIQHGKQDIARRRLEKLLAKYPSSSSAGAARELLEAVSKPSDATIRS